MKHYAWGSVVCTQLKFHGYHLSVTTRSTVDDTNVPNISRKSLISRPRGTVNLKSSVTVCSATSLTSRLAGVILWADIALRTVWCVEDRAVKGEGREMRLRVDGCHVI